MIGFIFSPAIGLIVRNKEQILLEKLNEFYMEMWFNLISDNINPIRSCYFIFSVWWLRRKIFSGLSGLAESVLRDKGLYEFHGAFELHFYVFGKPTKRFPNERRKKRCWFCSPRICCIWLIQNLWKIGALRGLKCVKRLERAFSIIWWRMA